MKVLNNKILIKLFEVKKLDNTGFVVSHKRTPIGVVEFAHEKSQVKTGDIVVCSFGEEISINEENYTMVDESNIIAIL